MARNSSGRAVELGLRTLFRLRREEEIQRPDYDAVESCLSQFFSGQGFVRLSRKLGLRSAAVEIFAYVMKLYFTTSIVLRFDVYY